jgi:hypothetical protein
MANKSGLNMLVIQLQMGRSIVQQVGFNYSNIYIQQDATLHSLFFLQTALHVSGGTATHHREPL